MKLQQIDTRGFGSSDKPYVGKVLKIQKLIPFKYSGHGSFYHRMDKFDQELMKFIEE